MATPPTAETVRGDSGPTNPRSAREKLEEALGKLEISVEEATPLVIDDRQDAAPVKWLQARKFLYQNKYQNNTNGVLKY